MTTVIATRDGIYTDTLCSYTVPFKVLKHMRIGDSIFAGAGDIDDLYRFFSLIKSDNACQTLDDGIDVLEVCKAGIFIWGKKMVRLKIEQDYYAVGTGAQYAIGAMAMGASPAQAIEIAALYDINTAPPFEFFGINMIVEES